MTAPELSIFFRPHGVAVIGASREPQKLGHGVVRNLLEYHYHGPIYPVNVKADEILGLKAFPSIASVPDPVELAIIVIPAPRVEAELIACGERGIKCVVVASGGFGEVGGEGIEREATLKRVAEQYGIHVIGPNCIGVIDTHTPLNTTFVVGMPRPGEIAFISQSGAVAAAVIDWARGSGVGFSRITSLGNQAVVTEAQMLEAIGQDGVTRVIAAYMEGVSNGPKFLESAIRTTRQMPVVILKAGRGRGGARAIASHTGALAGDQVAYDAAFRRSGILQAHNMEELFDWARALAWQPLPQGRRVAVLTNAGGAAILAVDALEEAGMEIATLTEATRDFLRQRVFAAASVNNPVDVLAGAGPATYALCLDALLGDETVDAVVVVSAPQDWFLPVSLAEVIGEVATSQLARKKPILAVLMGLASTSDATQVLHRKRIPNFAFPERVGSTLAAMWRHKQWLDDLAGQTDLIEKLTCDDEIGKMTVDAGLEVIRQRDDKDTGWMSPEQVDVLLAAYCIQTPTSGLAPSVEHAVPLAETIGYPVVLKVAAEDITHKTDVGGVALNITTPEQLHTTFKSLIKQAAEKAPGAKVRGVYVQHMIHGEAEIIVGVVRDPQFGPLVMAGLGGIVVELKRDVTFELAPLTRQQAENMLDRTGAGRVLDGFRGSPPGDRAAVVDTILRLAQIALDFPQVTEIEVNPLIVMKAGEGVRAVDARVKLDGNGSVLKK